MPPSDLGREGGIQNPKPLFLLLLRKIAILTQTQSFSVALFLGRVLGAGSPLLGVQHWGSGGKRALQCPSLFQIRQRFPPECLILSGRPVEGPLMSQQTALAPGWLLARFVDLGNGLGSV